MRHIRLVSFEDEPTGTLGLIIKGNAGPEVFADTSGRLLAHDILEHQNGIGRIGEIDDELEALGALWQVRGRHGDMVEDDRRGWYSPMTAVAHDVVTCAVDFDNSESKRWYPRLGQYRTHAHDYDEELMGILEEAKPMIRANLYEEALDHFPMDAFLDNALHLMRRGFRKAERRFGDGFEGVSLFRAIRDAIRPCCKWVEMPGQEFRLSYGNGRAYCEEVYADPYA